MSNFYTLSCTAMPFASHVNEFVLYSLLLVNDYVENAAANPSLKKLPSPDEVLSHTGHEVNASNLIAARISAAFIKHQYPEFGVYDDEIHEHGFQLNIEAEKLYISHDKTFDVIKACSFISVCLEEFKIDDPVTLTFACICSRPLPDSFGGGAAIINRYGFKTQYATDLLNLLTEKQSVS